MRNKQLIVLMLSLLLVLNTGCGSESDVQNGVNLRQNQLMGNEIVISEDSSDVSTEGSSATGNLGGSVGENNFGMTNLMDSIKDNNQTDVEHSLDLEEEKQEQSQPSSGNEGSVGSDVGSGNGTGNGTQTEVPSGNEGSGSGSSVGGNSGTGTQPQTPSGNGNLTQEQKDFINKETAEGENKYNDDNKYTSKEEVSKDSMLSDVDGWNSKIGAWEATDDLGNKGFMFPNGGWMEYDVAKALGLI